MPATGSVLRRFSAQCQSDRQHQQWVSGEISSQSKYTHGLTTLLDIQPNFQLFDLLSGEFTVFKEYLITYLFSYIGFWFSPGLDITHIYIYIYNSSPALTGVFLIPGLVQWISLDWIYSSILIHARRLCFPQHVFEMFCYHQLQKCLRNCWKCQSAKLCSNTRSFW